MHGAAMKDDTPYAVERAVMEDMHWSWSDLQNAPADLVDTIIESIAAERHWQQQRQKMDRAKQQAKR